MASPIHALLALLVALPSVVSAALAAQRGVQASRSRFRSSAAPPIYTASSLSDYHLGCKRLASADDTVLEVGCQLGGTTELLAADGGVAAGVLLPAHPTYTHVHVHESIDTVLETDSLLTACRDAHCRCQILYPEGSEWAE